jgi:hypothetical protein
MKFASNEQLYAKQKLISSESVSLYVKIVDCQDIVIKDIACANVKIVAINLLHDLCILNIDENFR